MIYVKMSKEEYEKLKETQVQHTELALPGLVWEWIDESELPWRKENVWKEDFADLTEEEMNEIYDAIDNSDVVGDLAVAIDRIAYAKYHDIMTKKNEI